MAQKETQCRDVDSYKHNDAERVNVIAAGVAPFYAHDSGEAAHYAFDANIDPRLEWSGKKEKSDLYVPIAGVHTNPYKTLVLPLKDGSSYNGLSRSLAILAKCGVNGIAAADAITFQFDAVDIKALEKADDTLVADFLTELHKIRSFSSAGGKLVYASFNKDKKVQGKADKSKRRLAYEAFKKEFKTETNALPDGMKNSIVCADSASFLATLPDNCVDMVLTSPPYNFGINYDSGGIGADDAEPWHDYFDKLFAVFDQCVRVLKSGGRIIVNVQPMYSDYIPTHHFISKHFVDAGLIWKGEILWEKNNYNCKYCTWGSWKSPASPYLKYSWEYIEVFCKNTLKKEGARETIDISDEEFKKWVYGKWSIAPERHMKEWGHDAMFPEELARRCIKLFSFKGDIVLDPFNGAGTTTKVAKECGRRFIGVDIDEGYCQTARKRLEEARDLFNTEEEERHEH